MFRMLVSMRGLVVLLRVTKRKVKVDGNTVYEAEVLKAEKGIGVEWHKPKVIEETSVT